MRDRAWRDDVIRRYRSGEPRGKLLHDHILEDLPNRGTGCTIVDIGCGIGLVGEPALQQSLRATGACLIGIEPDTTVTPDPCFCRVYRCAFEHAPLGPASADVIYCAFVLEHIENPALFWGKVHQTLRPGGVFWGLTVDSRSLFAMLSRAMGILGVKERYLGGLHGRRGAQRYATYGTFYRANSPRAIAASTGRFSDRRFISLHRARQMDYYFPRRIRWIVHLVDRLIMVTRLPGSVLLVRLAK